MDSFGWAISLGKSFRKVDSKQNEWNKRHDFSSLHFNDLIIHQTHQELFRLIFIYGHHEPIQIREW